jgi:hypothetical protein
MSDLDLAEELAATQADRREAVAELQRQLAETRKLLKMTRTALERALLSVEGGAAEAGVQIFGGELDYARGVVVFVKEFTKDWSDV